MGKTKTGIAAVICTAVSAAFIFIAFATPCWLEADGKVPNPKFERIGLWQICLHDFQDTRHMYDTRFTGCWWVFEEEYYIIRDFLLPGFFVATQFFFTLCFTLLLIGGFSTALYACCSRSHPRYQELLWALGGILLLSGIFGLISVIIFGARGDDRMWMPDWNHNDLSWGYAFAVLGSWGLIASGILFLVEGRRHSKRMERMLEEEPKTHTTI